MNKKISSFFCDPKTALKNTALLALMIFIVVYAFFQIIPSFSRKMETETALAATVFDANETNGYIFRNEEPVIGGAGGVVVTFVKDGERVSKGQHFANVYSAENYAELQEEIDVLDGKISILEKSSSETSYYVTDLAKIDEEIGENLDKIYSRTADGDLSGINSVQNELLVNLNKRGIITKNSDSYTSQLQTLKSMRNSLESRINAVSRKMTAQSSGYYYGDTDGYENMFTSEALENLTYEGFEQLTSQKPDESVLSSSCGKIVKSFVWNVVCESEKNAAAQYEENTYYNLVFPSYSDEELRMKLVKIIKNTSKDTVLLVFRGNTAPEGFTYTRNQQVNIISGKYSGYAVPKKAVRFLDGIQGVYITSGDIVRFRRIEIISEDGDYYIVKIPKAEASGELSDETADGGTKEKYQYLALYDNIIVEGKDLFDGKIVG